MMAITVLKRACRSCSRPLDLDHFIDDSPICNECLAMDRIYKERKKVHKKAKTTLTKILQQARPDSIKAPHITEVCAGVIEEIGGMDAFCKSLADDYRQARETKPGSSTVVKFGENIIRLVKDSSVLRDSAPDARDMSDDQLAGELLNLFANVAKENGIEIESDDLLLEMMQEAISDETAKLKDSEASE